MLEIIDPISMKEGEMYFIKTHDYIRELIFVEYQISANGQTFAIFTFPNCPGYTSQWLNIISVYRYISEEYYVKLKEKYYVKCLDIIIRRMIYI